MSREEIIARILRNADAIRALGAGSLYLYGSHARGEAGPGSDVDVFVDRDPTKHFGFIELTELEFLLRDILGADVDVSTRTALHPTISADIEKTAIKVL
ncbi:MAG: nucleotidyltransferase domain-containing protein [Hyphomonadaceae bacterium]|jgi:predicted nucleotidyltransferase|nr:nucleotidyltransferase domain-containing protein [Hyphomonadaceae bacterium]